MLAFTPRLAMLATFCSLLAVTILPASTLAAAVVESEGFNPLGSNGIYENDKRNEQLGVPGTIQLKVSHRHLFDDLILGLTGHFRA